MLNRSFSWLGPFALGAAAMYLLDPDRGGRRRALVRDKAIWAARKTRDGAAAVGCDLQNRAIGAVSELRSGFANDTASDAVIDARVRAELGRVSSHPGSISTVSTNGCVTLSGPILGSEYNQVLRAIGAVRGVCDVTDNLDVYESADGVPALQGGSVRPGQTWLRGSWAPTTQLAAAAAGLAAAAYIRNQRAH